MSNMTSIIKLHKFTKYYYQKHVDRLCNCRKKQRCPLDGKWLQTCIIHKADVIMNKHSHIYYGVSDQEYKSGYNNHTN